MRSASVVLAGIAVGAATLVLVAGPGPALGGDAKSVSAGSVLSGRTLYVESCSSCHGMDARGISGVAPSLIGVGGSAADFELSTGRMPMADADAQPVRAPPAFDADQRAQLVAYIASLGGPPVPAVDPASGSLSRGRRLFAQDCAGCHSATGAGGIVTGATVPGLEHATARQVVEAIRLGPYAMPRFGASAIPPGDANSIARYVLWTRAPRDAGGWSIGHVGPIPEGMVAWLVGLAGLLLVTRLLGERAK